MQEQPAPQPAPLIPFALKDAPALIETIFPAQKISFEAQTERAAKNGQSLTGLGCYWKGRKPLILARAIALSCLLPATNDPEKDLELFEKLMAVDDESLTKRALKKGILSAQKLRSMELTEEPDRYFSKNTWKRDVAEEEKLEIYRKALPVFASYEEKANLGKRPEEVDQNWLYAHTWEAVNKHYAHLGVNARNIAELTEQLGILRYGRRPKVGDAFCGGGSIPFEAARIGCDAYASDLNPIACMLTWGAFNVVGAEPKLRQKLDQDERDVFEAIDKTITSLGVEHDAQGNRAKSFLYCLETRCPETGWMIPLSSTWQISQSLGVIAQLIPDEKSKRFKIEILTGASKEQVAAAKKGTVQDGEMVYALHGKVHRTPIRTLRGDYRDQDGQTSNRLRHWRPDEFKPQPDDVFQERLYAINWIKAETMGDARPATFFASVTEEDLKRERQVEKIVAENLGQWQEDGLIPDMEIEPGDKTDEPIRTRGWTYWHHLFNPRQLLLQAIAAKIWRQSESAALGWIDLAKMADFNSKLCLWTVPQTGGIGWPTHTFANQALNPLYNYVARSWAGFGAASFKTASHPLPKVVRRIAASPANLPLQSCDIWITDPPYADAVNYHEITEYFIAWLRKNPPRPFDEWVWDSRRVMAIKGSGYDFRKSMIAAYTAMAQNMPDNGMQCVMFTHQDTSVWADMVGIFWAAGLQVVSAWYIATETSSALKKGGYVQGTVILMLKKRPEGEKSGFRQLILPLVRSEVRKQIEMMMNLNEAEKNKHGAPVFNDSDLQMAGYAAALKVLTSYTRVGGEDVIELALRPSVQGETSAVDEIVEQASQVANNLLVPGELKLDTWSGLSGTERFFLRMMDMESKGFKKLDNYQNFAKAFKVGDYGRLMGSMKANGARLKRVAEFESRDFSESSEIGATRLGRLILALQQLIGGAEPPAVVNQLQLDMPDFLASRPALADLLAFIEKKSQEKEVRDAAEILGARLRRMRIGQ